MNRRLRRAFFDRDPLDVAPDLLGKIFVAGECSGRIVEVEAYRGADDPGSHGCNGATPRTEVMFGPAGHLYVYFSYGMHWCANVVCGPDGTCGAVLVRALEPLTGIDPMYGRRSKAKRDTDLCSGPAKLTQALGLDGAHDGIDLSTGQLGVEIRDDGEAPDAVATSVRVGLAVGKGEDLPWRFYVHGNRNVSGRPR